MLHRVQPRLDSTVRWRRSTSSGIVAAWLITWTSLIGPSPCLWSAEKSVVEEYALKAAVIQKLTLFVTWPPDVRERNPDSILVGLLGKNPFGAHLQAALRGKQVEGRPVQLRECRSTEEAATCHIVFVSASEEARLAEILRSLESTRCLTVSDLDRFATAGGMITLATTDRKVRLVVNPRAIQSAGLRLDPQVLALATVVQDEPATLK